MSSNTDTAPQLGNAVKVKTPTSISLVGLPANQTAFKVVRKDSTGTELSPAEGSALKRVRRSASNPILQIAFIGLTTEDMHSTLKEYGMEDYNIQAEDGCVTATRSDLQTVAKDETTDQIKLREGVIATVKRSAARIARSDSAKHLKLVAVEFNAERHDEETANAWLTKNGVDLKVETAQNPDAGFIAKRSEVADGVEVRRMEVEEGVVCVLVLDDTVDVPAGVFEVISEAAYGNWGWGQLDFNARLADKAFCEAMESAICILRDTVYSLLFYSSLPLDVRQTLIANALSQFNDYTAYMMSVLPRQVLVAVSRNAKETPAVTNELSNAPAAAIVARTDTGTTEADAAAAAAAAAAQANVIDASAPITLTRAELDARVDAEITRRSEAAAAEAAAAAAAAAAPAVDAGTAAILARLDTLSATVTSLQTAQAETVRRMETGVVIRSDSAVAAAGEQPNADGKAPVVVQRDDPFKGGFGLGRAR